MIDPPGGPPWTGAHHIALTTRDLDATVRFYHGVLGMPLVGALPASPDHGPHVLLAAGAFIIHFFHQPDHAISSAPAGWKERFNLLPGTFQHLAFTVASEADLMTLRHRLAAAGVEVSELGQEGPLRFFYFTDNNGILWEATWAPVDLAALPPAERRGMLFVDPDPIPAVREIRDEGGLREQ